MDKRLELAMKSFEDNDNLAKLVKKYEPDELSLEDLDFVYAATSQPSYSKFLEKLEKDGKQG